MTNIFQNTNIKWLIYGKWISLFLAIITIITFAFAMTAIPISGVNAPINSNFHYPYLNTFLQYPRDFIWQYIALVQLIIFILFSLLLKENTKSDEKIFANISNSFALLSAVVLLITYYTQVMIVPVSLAKNETDGLGLLIQYNSHGLFIAMEELGYILMSFSLVSLIPIFRKNKDGCFHVRLLLIISFLLSIISFAAISIIFGLEKQDRFEIAVISINWLTLIILGIMLFKLFAKEEKYCIKNISPY